MEGSISTEITCRLPVTVTFTIPAPASPKASRRERLSCTSSIFFWISFNLPIIFIMLNIVIFLQNYSKIRRAHEDELSWFGLWGSLIEHIHRAAVFFGVSFQVPNFGSPRINFRRQQNALVCAVPRRVVVGAIHPISPSVVHKESYFGKI